MPKLSVYFVRAALVHMGIGFLFGSLILHHKGIPLYGWTWKLLTPHIELMIFGWTLQFVMGIAFWILPRFSHEPRYGRVGLGWCSFWVFNVGVAVAAIGGWFMADVALLLGRLAMLLAMLFFAVMIWPRVKPLANYPAQTVS